MGAVHPIAAGWVSTGGTGARNYDEFADDAEITAVVRDAPASVLAVEMPHRTPEAVAAGLDFAAALPGAVARLDALRADGHLAPLRDAVAVYRVGTDTYGVFCLVDTAEISSAADEPGLVVRNEDVFAAKVAERTALVRALGALVSPVLLLQTASADELHGFLADLAGRLGAPAVTDVDADGLAHAVWPLGPGPDRDRLLALAGGGELVVADGNHRSLAAQLAGLRRFLAVVTTPASVTIRPYHRLLRTLDRPVPALLAALRDAGVGVAPLPGPPEVPAPGTVVLYADGAATALRFPAPPGSVVERLDHALVETLLLRDVLGLDAGDASITYVGGDHPPSWFAAEVDAGRAAAALLLAPVTVAEFVAVNLERLTMPRKSTWFVPKARTGLVLADVSADVAGAAAPGPSMRP